MKAYIFAGGEGVTENNSIMMSDWSIDSITTAFCDYFGPTWSNDHTIEVLSNNLAQAVTDNVDYGMTYLVRA